MKIQKSILLIIFLILVIPIISAATAFYVPEDTEYSIRFGCSIDGSICSNSAECNTSIYYSNSTPLIKQYPATNLNGGEFELNLTVNQTREVGEYKLSLSCYDSNTNGTSTLFYEVNPSGVRSTAERTDTISRSIYFMLAIAILLFIGSLFLNVSSPVKWTYFTISILFFLISINLIFISLKDETVNSNLEGFFEGFTVISWYFYWFLGAFLIILWIFTFINTWLYKKNMNNINKYGGF